jgi:transcriptional regulator
VYTPRFNRADDEQELRALVDACRTAWLVTTGGGGEPLATLLPILWRADTVVAHMARANPHWREIPPRTPALLIVTGPDAYVSPSWYAAKREHGRVVPTWNYSAVHLRGPAEVHEDPAWLREAVTELTDVHEGRRQEPWQVTDAPEAYVEGQLRGIVGIEVRVTAVAGKAKLSQNRSEADVRGVVSGLRAEGRPQEQDVATAMERQIAEAR